MRKRKQFLYPLIASAVVTVMIGAGFLRREDRWAQDWLFQKQGVTSPEVVIIGIDEEALQELGPYQTWDRNVMASALEALAADPAKKPAVTAIDVLYRPAACGSGTGTGQCDHGFNGGVRESGHLGGRARFCDQFVSSDEFPAAL